MILYIDVSEVKRTKEKCKHLYLYVNEICWSKRNVFLVVNLYLTSLILTQCKIIFEKKFFSK